MEGSGFRAGGSQFKVRGLLKGSWDLTRSLSGTLLPFLL